MKHLIKRRNNYVIDMISSNEGGINLFLEDSLRYIQNNFPNFSTLIVPLPTNKAFNVKSEKSVTDLILSWILHYVMKKYCRSKNLSSRTF